MSGTPIAALVLGLGVMVVRRRSVAIGLVAAQSLLLGIGAIALTDGHGTELLVAGIVLIVRAGTLPAVLGYLRRRTPEARLIAAVAPGAARALLGIALALAAMVSVPPLGLDDPAPERGAIALVVIGIAVVVTRRPALFQVAGLLVAENGVYLLALSVAGGLPAIIELGVLFDLAMIVTVTAAFGYRIHRQVGTSDTDLLRGLRG